MAVTRHEPTVRPATPDDLDAILKLATASLGVGQIPRERDYWNWKHVDNPFGPSPSLVAEADGQLVGMRMFMRWDWALNGGGVAAVRPVDTATHPEWQGRGIFSKLTRSLVERVREDGIELIYNTPNEKSRPGYIKMGWTSAGRTDLMIRPLKPLSALWKLARAKKDAGVVRPHAAFPSAGTFLEDPSSESLLAAVRAQAPRDRLTTPLTREYLRWRYVAIPGFEYSIVAEGGNEPAAAIVFRHRDRGPLTELRICEVLLDVARRDAARSLRALVRQLQRTCGADYISAMASAPPARRSAMVRAGFVPAPRIGPILAVRSLSDRVAAYGPASRDRWCLSIGDLELF